MALPTILFNSATGSDTAASGAGPGTALFGTGASLNGTTTVTLSADTPDLSGVATDGSAVLWVDTTSGRQYSRITAVDNGADTVTVATTYSVTESGRNWGIGGKRATLNHADSKTLGADAEPGWIIEIAAGDTQTLTSTFTITADGTAAAGRIIFRGESGTRAIITSSTNSVALFTMNAANFISFSHLNLTHTAATRGAGITNITGNSNNVFIRDCVFDGCLSGITCAFQIGTLVVWGCEIKNSTSAGVSIRVNASFYGCYIHDNAVDGISLQSSPNGLFAFRCVIVKNTGKGIVDAGGNVNYAYTLVECTIADNTSHGINNTANATFPASWSLTNNLIYGNGGWGILSAPTQAGTDNSTQIDTNNAFGGNSSGARSGIAAGENEVTLSANPFTDDSGANRDFSLNNTAGGGAACRAAGYPGAFIGGAFTGYPDIGAVQHQDAGGTVGWW